MAKLFLPYRIALAPQCFSVGFLHYLYLLEGHWVQIFIEVRAQLDPESFHDTRGLMAVLVVLETLLRGMPGPAYIQAGQSGVRTWISAGAVSAGADDIQVQQAWAVGH